MSGYCPEHGAYTTRRYETGCPVCSPDREFNRLRERIENLEACVKAADALREKMRKVYQRPAFMGVFDVYRVHGFTYPQDDTDNWILEQDGYDSARAALGEVGP